MDKMTGIVEQVDVFVHRIVFRDRGGQHMSKLTRKLSILGAAAITLTCFALPASAQGNEKGTPQIVLPDTEITGERQKPEAFYILDKQNVGYEKIETDPSFIEEVVESVQRDPF